MLKVKIMIEDGNGKYAEIELSEADNLNKLVIIQNVFNLFGIESDVMHMTKTFKEIGKAYEVFFREVDPVESPSQTSRDVSKIREQLTKGYEDKDELDTTYRSVNDQPEFVRTGIKVDPDGTRRYKLRYKCPICSNVGNHYIYENSTKTWCHKCNHEMIVLLAGKRYMDRDTFGNFFRAGDYKDWNVIDD